MRNTRSSAKETLPGYMPESKAQKLLHTLFGMRRRLSVTEEGNMLLTGRTRRDIAAITPAQLAEEADAFADQSDTLLGC